MRNIPGLTGAVFDPSWWSFYERPRPNRTAGRRRNRFLGEPLRIFTRALSFLTVRSAPGIFTTCRDSVENLPRHVMTRYHNTRTLLATRGNIPIFEPFVHTLDFSSMNSYARKCCLFVLIRLCKPLQLARRSIHWVYGASLLNAFTA